MNDAEPDFRGKTVVITGASAGIGAAAARRFAQLGATVAVVGRSPDKTAAVAAEVGGRMHLANYGSLAEVRTLAADLLAVYPRIDILANNAGALFRSRETSADGHEMTIQVNYLAPFLLTTLLLDRLAASPDGARVINNAGMSYRKAYLDVDDMDGTRGRYRMMSANGVSKLAMLIFTRELARRIQGTGVTASAFHPGVVATELIGGSGWQGALLRGPLGKALSAAMISPEQGAEPLIHLAAVTDPQSVNGGYFHRLTPEEPKNQQATDADLARRLWQRSISVTGAISRVGQRP